MIMEGNLLVNATLDCVSEACSQREYIITNVPQLLEFLGNTGVEITPK